MKHASFPIYFGGEMQSHWSNDQLLVSYSRRPFVFATEEHGVWTAYSDRYPLLADEINQDPAGVKRAYFDSYRVIYLAITGLMEQERRISALPEVFSCPFSPLTAAELLRVLLDDWGQSWETALDLIARCPFTPADTPYRFSNQAVAEVQPRTAQLMEVLRSAYATDPTVRSCLERLLSRLIVHNSATEPYRSPIGSCPTDSTVLLRLLDDSGMVTQAVLLADGDGYHHRQIMERELSVNFSLPKKAVALRYRFRLTLVGGLTCWLCEVFGKQYGRISFQDGPGFRLTVYDKQFETPAWFRRQVMYQVFPDRFARDSGDTAQKGIDYHRQKGRHIEVSDWDTPVKWQPGEGERHYMPNDFYGGTFRGITEKLPYLESLGIGVLYLNPIVEACSNHRYDTADYLRPDPILGTTEDFQSLCRAAEQHGIRIMLDGVYSHTGADSIYFNRYERYDTLGACQGPQSPYYPWYDFSRFPDRYRSWWGFDSLPEVKETDPNWQNFVVTGPDSVVRTWLRRGAAGWRLDVADELPDEVLALIRTASKEESPENVVLGEVWEDAIEKESYGTKRRYALGNALDSVMNYPFRAEVLSFLSGQTDAKALADFLLSQRLHYPKPMYYALMNLLSSHDVPRIRTMLAIAPEQMPPDRPAQVAREITDEEDRRGAALQKLAAAIAFSLPGVPSVYYGDETGMNGFTDPFNRAPFHEGTHPLTHWYTDLGHLRKVAPALSTGTVSVFAGTNDVLAILRTIPDGLDVFGLPGESGVYLTAVNRSTESARCILDLMAPGRGMDAEELAAFAGMNCTTGEPVLGEGQLVFSAGIAQLSLPPVSACIFRLK